jgi:hypothetical protein
VAIKEQSHMRLHRIEEAGVDFLPSPEGKSLWSFAAWRNYLPGYPRLTLFRAGRQLESIASHSWEIAPGKMSIAPRAYFLPNQLERVTGMAYTDNPLRDMEGGVEEFQLPTRAFLVKNAWLLDGSLYTRSLRIDLHARWRLSRVRRHLPGIRVGREIRRGAIYSTFEGNEFFALRLMDDYATYPLAKNEGLPVTPSQPISPHILAYEDWLGMNPVRSDDLFMQEVVLFDDCGQNQDKAMRVRALAEKLLSRVRVEPHPGVFILRRGSGKQRIMRNEVELAEHLRERRGFRIVDATTDDLPTIVAACAGARVVIGIEGSQLVHGLVVLPPGGALLALQPPFRFSGVFKRMTDPQGQHYAFVVGRAVDDAFVVDTSEVERTLDLLPSAPY